MGPVSRQTFEKRNEVHYRPGQRRVRADRYCALLVADVLLPACCVGPGGLDSGRRFLPDGSLPTGRQPATGAARTSGALTGMTGWMASCASAATSPYSRSTARTQTCTHVRTCTAGAAHWAFTNWPDTWYTDTTYNVGSSSSSLLCCCSLLAPLSFSSAPRSTHGSSLMPVWAHPAAPIHSNKDLKEDSRTHLPHRFRL